MPLYHFNIYSDVVSLDLDGTNLADTRQASIEAIRYAGRLLLDHPERITLGEDWRMEVTDATGLILFHLDLWYFDTAGTMSRGSKDPERR